MSNATKLEELIRPDRVDADGYHIGQHVIPLGSPADSVLLKFQKDQRELGATDHQLAVLTEVRNGKLPADRPLTTITTPEAFLARGVEQKNGDVTIGALTIKKDVYQEYKAAILAGGHRDPEMVAVFEKLSNDTKPHAVVRTDGADSHAGGGVIAFDPAHGMIDYYNEAKLSPERVLKHEAFHDNQNPETMRILQRVPDKMYGNLEERNAEIAEARGMDPNNLMRGSHYANVAYTARSTSDAQQACEFPEIAVRMGANGTGALRSVGLDVSGTFDHSEGTGSTWTLYYKAGGELKAMSFETRPHVVEGDPGRANPLANVTEHLEPGDQFNLKIRRDGTATFTNATRGEQIDMRPDGEVEAKSVDRGKAKSLELAP